jgi:hypothetical protein
MKHVEAAIQNQEGGAPPSPAMKVSRSKKTTGSRESVSRLISDDERK